MSKSQVLRGSKLIAHELGVSVRTLYRQMEKGLVPVQKGGTGGRTSPLLLDRSEIGRRSDIPGVHSKGNRPNSD